MDESLAVIFYVVFVNTMTSESFFFSDKPGKLTPTDYYLFVGEQLNMTCKLTDSTVSKGDNSSMLYFTYGNDIPIPEEDTFIISRSSKGFTHTIDSVFDRPYHCNFNTSISITKITFVDSTMVTAEYESKNYDEKVTISWYHDYHHMKLTFDLFSKGETIHYYPRPVTNFNCIIYDWDEKMECSWDLGVNYFNIKYISTNLTLSFLRPHRVVVRCQEKPSLTLCIWHEGAITFWPLLMNKFKFHIEVMNIRHMISPVAKRTYIGSRDRNLIKAGDFYSCLYTCTIASICVLFLSRNHSGYSGVCPGQRLQLTNCTWLKSDRISFDRSQLSFNIEVTNTKKDVTVETGWITISQNDYVKPSPVESLNIQSYTSTWVVLKWSHKRTHRLKYFIINLKSKWGDDKVVESDNMNMNETVYGLRPNTEYTISIVTRPGRDKGYPSEPVEKSFTTCIDIPGKPPDVGNYFISYENCKANIRGVTVYWKALPEIDLNSPNVNFHVEVKHPNKTIYDTTFQHYSSFDIPCIDDVLVSVWSKNEAGRSSESSTIRIPKIDDLLPPSRVIVEAQNTSTDTAVTISWTPSSDNRIKCHTVYYCQYDTECTDDIDWSTVCGNDHTMTITNTELQFDRKYRFGVSSDANNKSSGFKWQHCYYVKSNVPTAPLKVEVQAYPDDSLTVSWSEPECGQSPYIALYRIRWCTTVFPYKVCSGNEQEMNISSTKPTKHVIGNLLAGTTYGVKVSHITADGRASEFSEMEYEKPINSDLDKGEVTGMAIGGVFVFLMSIAGVVFLYRRASQNCRKLLKPPNIEKIEIPHTTKMITPANSTSSSSSSNGDASSTSNLLKNGNPGYYQQISRDSGRGSVSSEGLASPGLTAQLELDPVMEDDVISDDPKTKFTGDKNTRKTPFSANPDYSKVTHDPDDRPISMFHQGEITVATALCSSYPNISDKKFSVTDGSSQKISNTTLASCKSSSDEKLWLDMDDQDNDGYVDEKDKSKSLEAVSSKRRSTGGVDSYVQTGQVSGMNSNITDYSDIDSGGETSPYVDVNEVNPLPIGTNQDNTESHNMCSQNQNRRPLLEIEEDSNISMISSGCYDDRNFNPSGKLISTPQLSCHSDYCSKTDAYHRLDSIENPCFNDQSSPLISTRDSTNCTDYVPIDRLPVQFQGNLPSNENMSVSNSDCSLNYVSDPMNISASPYITEITMRENNDQVLNNSDEEESDLDSDSHHSDESNTLLSSSELTKDGYVPHNFHHS